MNVIRCEKIKPITTKQVLPLLEAPVFVHIHIH